MKEDPEYGLFVVAAKLRGAMMEGTVEIERKTDAFLSKYFCNSEQKGNELMELLWFTERVTFGSKKDILFTILNRNYKAFIKDNPSFITTMENIIPHRNIFAHLEIDRSYEGYDGAYIVRFKKYVGGKLKYKTYGAKEIDRLKEDFRLINKGLDFLLTNSAPNI